MRELAGRRVGWILGLAAFACLTAGPLMADEGALRARLVAAYDRGGEDRERALDEAKRLPAARATALLLALGGGQPPRFEVACACAKRLPLDAARLAALRGALSGARTRAARDAALLAIAAHGPRAAGLRTEIEAGMGLLVERDWLIAAGALAAISAADEGRLKAIAARAAAISGEPPAGAVSGIELAGPAIVAPLLARFRGASLTPEARLGLARLADSNPASERQLIAALKVAEHRAAALMALVGPGRRFSGEVGYAVIAMVSAGGPQAARALEAVAEADDSEALQVILRSQAANGSLAPALRARMLARLGRFAPTAERGRWMAAQLARARAPEVRRAAAVALAYLDPAAADAAALTGVLQALSAGGQQEQLAALVAVDRLGAKAHGEPGIARRLIALCRSLSPEVRAAAARALASTLAAGGPRAKPAAGGDDGPEDLAELVRQLSSRRYAVRERATRQLLAKSKVVLEQLQKAAASSDLEVKQRASQVIRQLTDAVRSPREQMRAWPMLLREVRAYRNGQRREVRAFLKKVGPEGRDEIIQMLLDPTISRSSRDTLVQVLLCGRAVHTFDPKALLEGTRSRHSTVRRAAADGLAVLRIKSALPRILEMAKTSESVEFCSVVRAAMVLGDKQTTPAAILAVTQARDLEPYEGSFVDQVRLFHGDLEAVDNLFRYMASDDIDARKWGHTRIKDILPDRLNKAYERGSDAARPQVLQQIKDWWEDTGKALVKSKGWAKARQAMLPIELRDQRFE